MIQSILIGISLMASVLGLVWDKPIIWDETSLSFGATNFPTSLDSLTNPSGTDSVATVSHSSQHSNANDAIEALEAKLGVTSSTAVSGTVLAGNGAGSSLWTTYATTTSLSTTNITANGSSTLQNFTFVNATGTSATTTNFFSTVASSTILQSTSFYGGGVPSCTGSNALQWSNGSFSCAAISSGVQLFSTTTSVNLATTTIRSTELPATDNLIIKFITPRIVGSGATTTADIWMNFNDLEDTVKTNYGYAFLSNATNNGENNVNYFRILRQPDSGNDYRLREVEITIHNVTGLPKTGNYNGMTFSTSTGAINLSTVTDVRAGRFVWASTTKATSINIWPSIPNVLFATGTQITIMGW